MRIYDVSLTLSPSLPVWPGDPAIVLERIEKIEDGANANVSRMDMSVHTGTHVDAPYHFLGGNTPTVEQLPLNILTGRALVVHLPIIDRIDAKALEKIKIPAGTRRVLIKTRNSEIWSRGEMTFQTDFVGISPDGAEFLIRCGIKLIGIDYLSIAPFKQSRPTHELLLAAGVVVVEGLDLSQVSPGKYMLYCLPLKLQGSDGAPARVIMVGP